jgi:hypothetical protein
MRQSTLSASGEPAAQEPIVNVIGIADLAEVLGDDVVPGTKQRTAEHERFSRIRVLGGAEHTGVRTRGALGERRRGKGK